MLSYSVTLYSTNSAVTLQSDGFVLATGVTSDVLGSHDLTCYFLNYEQPKTSEIKEVVGGLLKDKNIYTKEFDIVTERYTVADFNTQENNLLAILTKANKYIQVNSYEFVPFPSGKIMPFVVKKKDIEWNAGKKWFALGLEINNKGG